MSERPENANHFEVTDTSSTSPGHLLELLQVAAETSTATITTYPLGEAKSPIKRSYKDILCQARKNANLLRHINGIKRGSKLLLHFDQHLENVEWLWSAVAANLLPAMSTPFVSDKTQRKKHLVHLHELFQSPVILTKEKLVSDFLGLDHLDIHKVESLEASTGVNDDRSACRIEDEDHHHEAILMLTSGSTGNVKAVGLSHGQLISAMNGKRKQNETTSDDVFLNWIGLDHVAGFSEIHLHATSLGAEQIHVQAADLLLDPLYFLDLLHRHRVTYTFAPNFFLALLRRSLDTVDLRAQRLDLSSLRIIQTGGEAAVVETCRALTEQLRLFGVPRDRNVIRPGFGMTETCAGSVYHKQCPKYDLEHNLEFASLGSCMPGVQMRIVAAGGSQVLTDEVGDLQLSGPAVFSGYFNDPQSNLDAFTSDGWFITGDRARLDEHGYLNLVGRPKETIIINGVKHSPHELETALNEALIPGMTASYTVVFPHRPSGSETETFCVAYLPNTALHSGKDRTETSDAIVKVCGLVFGVKPYQILPLERSHLPKTSLGKISRAKVRTAFESGAFADLHSANNDAIRKYRAEMARQEGPVTAFEKQILDVFVVHFELPAEEVGVNSSIHDLGITSVELIGYRKRLEERLDMKTEIQLPLILSNPSIRGLAGALEASVESTYNPVVILQPHGEKTPLWLIHPGVGEILVFLNLSRYLAERPVYALRARGFSMGESFFNSIDEVINTYHNCMKKTQPHGPYAIAGYSFGAMLAFEISKMFEADGDEVRFLGSFNLPPHIKARMRQLDWIQALLNLSYFLGLITEGYAEEVSKTLVDVGSKREAVLETVMQTASPARLKELSLDRDKLATWASLAHAMQHSALEYEPSRSVACIDVFIAIPLVGIANSKEEWYRNHLSRWEDFSRTKPRYHDVDGAHYTMMDADNVHSFQKKLRCALEERGL